jgi:hypothetical protein
MEEGDRLEGGCRAIEHDNRDAGFFRLVEFRLQFLRIDRIDQQHVGALGDHGVHLFALGPCAVVGVLGQDMNVEPVPGLLRAGLQGQQAGLAEAGHQQRERKGRSARWSCLGKSRACCAGQGSKSRNEAPEISVEQGGHQLSASLTLPSDRASDSVLTLPWKTKNENVL